MSIRLMLKSLVCWLGFGDRLVEFCERCGRETEVVWHASDELWRETTGILDSSGVFCVRCFDAANDRRGRILRWVPHIAHERGPDGQWRNIE